MSRQPLIRDGKLVGSPFDGIKYDLKKLTVQQAKDMQIILDKSRAGEALGQKELQTLLTVRKAARTADAATVATDPVKEISDLVGKLRTVMR